MESRVDEAVKRHDKGYNCAQAVACTYCDLVGMDEKTMFRLTEGMGAGMGSMDGTCGAVSGVCILAGLKNSSGNLEHPDSKRSTYSLSSQVMNEFRQKNGSCVCRELKGIDTGKVLRPCAGCIEDAVRITSEVLSL